VWVAQQVMMAVVMIMMASCTHNNKITTSTDSSIIFNFKNNYNHHTIIYYNANDLILNTCKFNHNINRNLSHNIILIDNNLSNSKNSNSSTNNHFQYPQSHNLQIRQCLLLAPLLVIRHQPGCFSTGTHTPTTNHQPTNRNPKYQPQISKLPGGKMVESAP
jgi:hypothetical protein